MSNNIQNALLVAGGFVLIGCLTWFFSSRRKTFLRVFVPADELREASRAMPRDESFGQGMRFIALLQIGAGVLIGLIALGAWLAW